MSNFKAMKKTRSSKFNLSTMSDRKKAILLLSIVLLVVAVICVMYWNLILRHSEGTDDAYVQGNIVQVTPQIPGTVVKILADDTNVVKAGDALITFDTADADIALAQAEAQLAQTIREVRALYASRMQFKAALAQRRIELDHTEKTLARRTALTKSSVMDTDAIYQASFAVKNAKAALEIAKEQLLAAEALTENTSIERHPNVQRAIARVQELSLAKSRTTLYAPVSGQIVKRSAQVGQRVAAGASLMSIVPMDQLWVEANFRESQLRKIRPQQSVTLTTDLYGSSVTFHGKILGMAAGTGSAFSLLPPQNATGNWVKVVQRVPVRIALDPQELKSYPLRIGISVRAEVQLDDVAVTADEPKANTKNILTSYISPSITEQSEGKARVTAILLSNTK